MQICNTSRTIGWNLNLKILHLSEESFFPRRLRSYNYCMRYNAFCMVENKIYKSKFQLQPFNLKKKKIELYNTHAIPNSLIS